jgi:CheY-like chemotaxis protein
MDGWNTFERIRDLSNLHNVPIAIVSASHDPADMTRARGIGAAGFIKKPAERDSLIKMIRKSMKNN